MMSLRTQLTEDMKQAMRDRSMVKLNAIRFLLAALRNYEIDNGEQDDAGIQKIVSKVVKQMEEAIVEYQKGDRADLVAEEQEKIAALKPYLPELMSETELKTVVDSVLAGMENPTLGQVIGAVRAQVGNKADGSMIATLVKQALS